jgi:hypothetical protein
MEYYRHHFNMREGEEERRRKGKREVEKVATYTSGVVGGDDLLEYKGWIKCLFKS